MDNNEKNINPDKSARDQPKLSVIAHYQQNGYCSQPIDVRAIGTCLVLVSQPSDWQSSCSPNLLAALLPLPPKPRIQKTRMVGELVTLRKPGADPAIMQQTATANIRRSHHACARLDIRPGSFSTILAYWGHVRFADDPQIPARGSEGGPELPQASRRSCGSGRASVSAFSHAPISRAATFACVSNLPMVKKPWNWPGKCL